jgi:hypothetical protein
MVAIFAVVSVADKVHQVFSGCGDEIANLTRPEMAVSGLDA